jgi:hypothetical protein
VLPWPRRLQTLPERRLYVTKQNGNRSKNASSNNSVPPAGPSGVQINPVRRHRLEAFPGFPTIEAVVVGQPSEKGPYTIRVKVPHGLQSEIGGGHLRPSLD